MVIAVSRTMKFLVVINHHIFIIIPKQIVSKPKNEMRYNKIINSLIFISFDDFRMCIKDYFLSTHVA